MLILSLASIKICAIFALLLTFSIGLICAWFLTSISPLLGYKGVRGKGFLKRELHLHNERAISILLDVEEMIKFKDEHITGRFER